MSVRSWFGTAVLAAATVLSCTQAASAHGEHGSREPHTTRLIAENANANLFPPSIGARAFLYDAETGKPLRGKRVEFTTPRRQRDLPRRHRRRGRSRVYRTPPPGYGECRHPDQRLRRHLPGRRAVRGVARVRHNGPTGPPLRRLPAFPPSGREDALSRRGAYDVPPTCGNSCGVSGLAAASPAKALTPANGWGGTVW
ncbi:hypothetical protein GCM10020000_03740 [Streptomyces olivoverticillatus]